MEIKNKRKIILNILVFLFLFPFLIVRADTPLIPNPLSGVNCLPELLERIADFILNLAAALMVPFIVWGGIVIMTAAGNPKKVVEGRNIIIYTMVGVLVALLAKVMTSVITQVFIPPGTSDGC